MKDQDGEVDVLGRLVQWANSQPLVRALVLESSRAREDAALDALSDYDVLLIVADTRVFAHDETWLHHFGTILVLFRDQGRMYGLRSYNRLVLYEDGTKVDYIIWPVALLQRVLGAPKLPDLLDYGYQVLVDKDHLASQLKAPTYRAHIPHKPTAHEYQLLMEEFWWETIYVAKNLWRDELLHLKYNLECVMKCELLRRVLEWRIELDHHWSWKPGAVGRGLKKQLDQRTWDEFASTFVGAEIEENWQALFRTTALFRRVAMEVGEALGHRYPAELDERVTRYLQRIRNLEPGGTQAFSPSLHPKEVSSP
jgi:aminoglycoside 6-adenylyltransferase